MRSECLPKKEIQHTENSTVHARGVAVQDVLLNQYDMEGKDWNGQGLL